MSQTPFPPLHVTIRTPAATIVELDVRSMRVPTKSGLVGLRPRGEPSVLAIEAGLIVLRLGDGWRYAGTAGGLLHAGGTSASLLTPLAVVGDDVDAVSRELDALLAAPECGNGSPPYAGTIGNTNPARAASGR